MKIGSPRWSPKISKLTSFYVWQRMGRGFVREYLDKSQCDLLIGIPGNFRPVLTTTPYYRSSYVFVSRRGRKLQLTSGFDSPALHPLKIGVQVLDEEYTPPGEALARRGLQAAIVGFDTTGDSADSIMKAVANHQVDVAVVWGPLAGYFAQKYHRESYSHTSRTGVDPPGLPFTFAISMGVRKGNFTLRDELEQILNRRNSRSGHSRPIRSSAIASCASCQYIKRGELMRLAFTNRLSVCEHTMCSDRVSVKTESCDNLRRPMTP